MGESGNAKGDSTAVAIMIFYLEVCGLRRHMAAARVRASQTPRRLLQLFDLTASIVCLLCTVQPL